jgi:hypothetical protein
MKSLLRESYTLCNLKDTWISGASASSSGAEEGWNCGKVAPFPWLKKRSRSHQQSDNFRIADDASEPGDCSQKADCGSRHVCFRNAHFLAELTLAYN